MHQTGGTEITRLLFAAKAQHPQTSPLGTLWFELRVWWRLVTSCSHAHGGVTGPGLTHGDPTPLPPPALPAQQGSSRHCGVGGQLPTSG